MLTHSTPACPGGCQSATPCLCWLSAVAYMRRLLRHAGILEDPHPRPDTLSPPVQVYGGLIFWEL